VFFDLLYYFVSLSSTWYKDGADNTNEEYSSVISLIQIH